jgi:hypothetical protein
MAGRSKNPPMVEFVPWSSILQPFIIMDEQHWPITNLTHSIQALFGPIYLNALPRVFKSQGRSKHALGNKTLTYFKRHFF